MNRYIFIFGWLIMTAGCGATAPPPSLVETPEERAALAQRLAEPVMVAILPFENRSGQPDLDRLGNELSGALSVRLKEQHGWTYVAGTRVRQAMTDHRLVPAATLEPQAAVTLGDALNVLAVITGAVETVQDTLVVTASHLSGKTGETVATVAVRVQKDDRAALLRLLTAELARYRPSAAITARTVRRPSSERPARPHTRLMAEMPEDLDQAVRLYWQMIDGDPNFAEAHFALGYTYDQKGELDKALASYEQATALDSLNADYWFILGYTYERMQNLSSAEEAYKRARAIKPQDADLAFALGYVYEQQGKVDDAITMYRRVTELKPGDYEAYAALAVLQESAGRLEEAFERYRRVVAARPRDLQARRALAEIAERLEKWDEAIAAYEALVEARPDDYDAHLALARIYYQQHNVDKAAEAYGEVLRLNPGASFAHPILAGLYVRKKDYDSALVHYQAAVAADPNAAILYYNMGSIYEVQRKYREAVDAYSKYLDILPDGEYAPRIRAKLGDLRIKALSQQ